MTITKVAIAVSAFSCAVAISLYASNARKTSLTVPSRRPSSASSSPGGELAKPEKNCAIEPSGHRVIC